METFDEATIIADLSKLYSWEEKKSKTSWGAETVDYEKRVSGFVLANPELKSWRLRY